MRLEFMISILLQANAAELPLATTRIHRLPRELFTAQAEQLIARATSLAPGINRAPQPPATGSGQASSDSLPAVPMLAVALLTVLAGAVGFAAARRR